MPHLVAVAATVVSNIVDAAIAVTTGSEALAATIASTAYFATEVGITLGASALLNKAAMQNTASAEAIMTALNQTRPPWRWGVGRMRISGPRALWQNVKGWAVESQMLHEGRVDGFEQVYLSDQKVTVKANGFVQGIGDAYAENLVGIWLRPGRTTEIATPNLTAVCGDDWTYAHRNDGVAALDMMIKAVRDQDVTRRYPTSGAPEPSVVTRLSRVYDWRDNTQSLTDPSTWKWSENAVLCHLTWEWYGRYLQKASIDNITPNAKQLEVWTRQFAPALDFWTTAADIAGQMVTRKDGSTAMRYRVALMTLSTDDPATVRAAFLKAYDGWMLRRSDGAWTVRAGQYVNPTFEITDANIKELTWDNGADSAQYVNVLEGSFLSPDNDYTTQAIDPWVDPASATEGEVRDTFDLPMVPDHEQARMLLKREMYRRRADRTGTVTLDLSGLDIADEAHRWIRCVRLNGPLSMRNVVLEIAGEGKVDFNKLSVSFPVRISAPAIDEWTPSLEAGFKPNDTNRTPPTGTLPPSVLDGYALFQSDRSALLVLKVEDTGDDSVTYQISYLDDSGKAYDQPWQEGDTVTGGIELRAGPVGLGDYTAIVRMNQAGRISNWSNPPLAISATAAAAPYFPPTYSDGTDINTLKPAEPGADVTGDNTSKDTQSVNGRPANDVTSGIDDALTNAASAAAAAAQEASDRAAQVAALSASLGAQIDAVAAQVSELAGTEAYDADKTYSEGDVVQGGDGALYAAITDVPVSTPPPNATYWKKIGDYGSVGEALSALAVQTTDNTTQIGSLNGALSAETSERETLAAQLRGDYAGDDPAAVTTGLVYGLKEAQVAGDTVLASSIDALSASLDGKADASALASTNATVTAINGTLTSTVDDLSSLTAKTVNPNQNLLKNPSGALGLQYWTATNTITGGSVQPWASYNHPRWGWWFYKILTGASPNTGIDLLGADSFGVEEANPYTISGYGFNIGLSDDLWVYVEFRNASNLVVDAFYEAIPVGAVGQYFSKTYTSPSGAVKAVVYLDIRSGISFDGTYAQVGAWQIKFERGSVATTFSDDATYGPVSTANAQAIADTNITVTQQGDDITSALSQIASLSASLDGKADASALASTNATVTAQGEDITAVTESLDSVSATVGDHTTSISELSSVQATHDTALATIQTLSMVDGKVSGTVNKNDGTTSLFVIKADIFGVESDDGTGLGWADGVLTVHDPSGSLRVEMGALS